MVRAALASLLASVALLVPAGTAAAQAEREQPWATINVCDTRAYPDAVGVRAFMPALVRRHERMRLRIRLEWRDPATGVWEKVTGSGGDSGWIRFGRARGRSRETGRVFRFESPPEGETQRLRGLVRFEWRVRKRLVRTRVARTERGHRSAAGSDPKGYSAATCELVGR